MTTTDGQNTASGATDSRLSGDEIAAVSADSGGMVRRGVFLGMISAVAYSAANLALRGLSGRHEDFAWSVWVTATKAAPTVALALILLSRRYLQRQPLFPARHAFPGLLAAAFLMQFGGNLGFQVALGHIGLAITVPLVFAFIICAGAVLGKWYLGDTVSSRTAVSMLVMTISIILLSYAATLHHPPAGAESTATDKVIWFGILMAVVSGLSYGINGVVIRGISRNTLPVESMLIVYSTTGLISLGIVGGSMMGADRLYAIRPDEWGLMLCAGVFNAIAFFSITNALKLMNISHVNVINASQNAMCAVAAVLIFAEPVSVPMVAGIVLSIVGLVMLDRR